MSGIELGSGRAATSTRPIRAHGTPLWRRLLASREATVAAVLVIAAIVATIVVPYFGTTTTLAFLLLDATPILMIALPMTFVIITGEIDLSVGSTVGLSSVVLGLLTQAGVPFPVSILVCLVVGLACGALNGFLVTGFGLPSIAVTIGTIALFRGIAVGLLGTTSIATFPAFWLDLAQRQIGTTGIPVVMVLVIVLILVFAAVLHFTPFGRGLIALGLSSDAATFSGVRVARSKFIAFVLSGVVSALAGVFWTLRYSTARGDNATGLELSVIAAVLLGGVSIFGGKGSLPGVVAGVLLIGVLQSALQLASVSSDAITVVTGVVLILSVVVPQIVTRVRVRRPQTG
ncbi:ABC transporter permease [Curtobacterium sp. ZW137]|uniref:ABC transporter permease n=1 Tax=Curtobacterium sp. ZW137 TaxID=2485104 RepID=UPI000F4BC651|nr:ABC transporter permease [Curtobacterium sp. ZW137]ROP60933.1 rhamnose transport system permease protein [Curtobacterium sp. ZW137]